MSSLLGAAEEGEEARLDTLFHSVKSGRGEDWDVKAEITNSLFTFTALTRPRRLFFLRT